MESVRGLHYIDQYISNIDEKNIIDFLKEKDWKLDEKRKFLEYRYDNKNSDSDSIPIFLKELSEKISKKFQKNFDQIIISQNPKGHGISSHIDNTKLFGDTVVILTLNDNCMMKFENDKNNILVSIKKNGMIMMEGDARYKWKHSILSYKKGFDFNKANTWINITFRCTNKDI